MSANSAERRRSKRGAASHAARVYSASGLLLAEGKTSNISENGVLVVAKIKGANATTVADAVLQRIEEERGRLLPSGVQTTVTRNYGETAKEKSDELLFHMGLATVSVIILIWIT